MYYIPIPTNKIMLDRYSCTLKHTFNRNGAGSDTDFQPISVTEKYIPTYYNKLLV